MRVAFRVDASLEIGSGHVMRCLTLADAFKGKGAQCYFICREHPGHLLELVRQRGHILTSLSPLNASLNIGEPRERSTVHAAWLGCAWQIDAAETATILAQCRPDWLVVDHYALDYRWEEAVAPYYKKLLVIDDLADRRHRSDLLLDQNLGRQNSDYVNIVPLHCQILTSPHYALLRPEFAAARAYSLSRRQKHSILHNVIISMGGVDQPNATGLVLQILKQCSLSKECTITVVMGLKAPWLQIVRALSTEMPWPTEVVVNVNNMAQRMANSDLAIGAAGSTSWERCCLGVPALMMILADNQTTAARHLEASGAAACFKMDDFVNENLYESLQSLLQQPKRLSIMANCAAVITDGLGTARLLAATAKVLN